MRRGSRILTATERAFLATRASPIVYAITVSGDIDPILLGRALELLTREYPLLRGRIQREDAEPALVVDEADAPEFTVGRDGTAAFDAELSHQGTRSAVAHFALFRDHAESTVQLGMNHAVADGRLVVTLVNKLFHYFTRLTAGDDPRPSPRPWLEETLESRLLHTYGSEQIQVGPDASALGSAPLLPSLAGCAEDPPFPRFALRHVRLDQAATDALRGTAQEHGISLNSLLCGALVRAARDEFPADPATVPVSIGMPVDLRPHLRPAVPPDAQLVCVGPCLAVLDVGPEADCVTLGKRIAARVSTAVRCDEPQRTVLAQRPSLSVFPPPAIVLSNLGQVSVPPLPDRMHLVRSRFAATMPGPIPGMLAMTLAGQLTMEFVHDRAYRTEGQMADLVSGFITALDRATGRIGLSTEIPHEVGPERQTQGS